MSEVDELGRRIWDISQSLRASLPVWPGDTAYEETRTWLLEGDCPVNVSRLTLSTHAGAHADAPRHYDAQGETIGQVSLVPYLGAAQVITARGAGERIALSEVADRLQPGVKRVLLRTYDRFPHEAWRSDYRCPSPGLVDHLGAAGVTLIGIDSPSLDPETAKDLVGHKAVRRWGMAILEGLVLDDIEDGLYELIAAPLRLETADAAPVRAILRAL